MEQVKNTERRIVHWKKNNSSWSVNAYLDDHPQYRNKDPKTGILYWETILTIADQLGFDEETLHELFDRKPEYQIVDFVFAMYLVRLYGTQAAEEFFGYKSTINMGEVHGFLKGQEGLIRDVDIRTEPIVTDTTLDNTNIKAENTNIGSDEGEISGMDDFKLCVKNLTQILSQNEAARNKYEKTMDRLVQLIEKNASVNQQTSVNGNTDVSEHIQKRTLEDQSYWERILKLEKENASLKEQLEAEKREAAIKHDAVVELKDLQVKHLKEQMDIYIEDLGKQIKENQKLKQMITELSARRTEKEGGLLRNRRKKQTLLAPLNERQELAVKIIGGSEYPEFLKAYIGEAYQSGLDLKRMQVFDNPKLEECNFEMMKAIIEGV